MNDTVIQLLSNEVIQSSSNPENQSYSDTKSPTRVLRFANTSGGREYEFSLNEALPRNPDELKRLTEMAGGPLWRLVGAMLAFEMETGIRLEEKYEDVILKSYCSELQKYATSISARLASNVEIEDAFFRHRDARRVPAGVHSVKWAGDQAKKVPLPPEAKRWKDELPRKAHFVAALRQLASLSNDGTFFLGCRDAAEFLDLVDRNEASRWLRELCTGREPILRLVDKGRLKGGGKGDASKYVYLPLENREGTPSQL